MKEFFKNANPLRTPERVLTVVGWSLAFVFGFLLFQQDRTFEEVSLVEPRTIPAPPRQPLPPAHPVADSREVYDAMDLARRRLQHKDPRRSLEAISRAWTLCHLGGLEPPAELYTLFAETMAELVHQSRPGRRVRASATPSQAVKSVTAAPSLDSSQSVAPREARTVVIKTNPRTVPERSYPKARKSVRPVKPEFQPPLPPVASQPPHRPGGGDFRPPGPPPGMPPNGMRNRGPGQFPPGPPRPGGLRDRHPSYPPPPPGFPEPRGYEVPSSPPGY